MKIGFKRLFLALIVLVVVTLAGLAIFLLTLDPNVYKGRIEQLVYERYQRTLSIDGKIELSLFPRIGLSVQNVSLSNPDQPEDLFASIDSARFAIAIWPLLFNRLIVDHVAVSGLKAWVRKSEQGRYNFEDLVRKAAASPDLMLPAQRDETALNQPRLPSLIREAQAQEVLDVGADEQIENTTLHIDIAGLELKESEVHYLDVKSAKAVRLVNLRLTTGRMTFDQPFDVVVRGTLKGDNPVADAKVEAQALLQINPARKTYSAQKLDLAVVGQVGPLDAKTVALRGNLAYDRHARVINASSFEIQVRGAVQGEQAIQNLNASLVIPRLKINQARSEFNIEKLALRAVGDLPDRGFDLALDAPKLSVSPESAEGQPIAATVKLTGSQTLGLTLGMNGLEGNAWNLSFKELKIESQLKEGEQLVVVNLSTPAQWDLLNKKGALSAIKGDMKIQGTNEPQHSFEFPFIGSLQTDLGQDKLGGEINAVLHGAPLSFSFKASKLAHPDIQFALKADKLDFDEMFPSAVRPVEAGVQAGQDKNKEAQVQPQPSQDKPGQPQVAKAQPPTKLNLELLNHLSVAGTVSVKDLQAVGLHADDFAMSLSGSDGQLALKDIFANVYAGALTGSLTADATSALSGRIGLKQVEVGPMVQALAGRDYLAGKGDINIDFKSHGQTMQAQKAALGGNVQIRLRDGMVRGADLDQTLQQIAQVLGNTLGDQSPGLAADFDSSRYTSYSVFDGALSIDKGIASIKKLDIRTPLLRISEGKPALIDLPENRYDLQIKLRASGSNKDLGKHGLSVLRGVTVPLLVHGPLNEPGLQIQWQQMGGSLVKNAIERGLLDLLGQDGQAKQDQQDAQPLSGQTTTSSQTAVKGSSAVKDLGKALKGLLNN